MTSGNDVDGDDASEGDVTGDADGADLVVMMVVIMVLVMTLMLTVGSPISHAP